MPLSDGFNARTESRAGEQDAVASCINRVMCEALEALMHHRI
jgi:hypothetical protein